VKRALILTLLLATGGFAEPQLSHPADAVVCHQPLGALWSPQETMFRVWAPTAEAVELNLYPRPQGPGQSIPMRRNDDGSWERSVPGDLRGRYYTYRAAGAEPGFNHEVIDPYARAVSGYAGRGLVVEPGSPAPGRPDFGPDEAVIYELHLRDFTIDKAGMNPHPGKFLGLVAEGTQLRSDRNLKTGLAHLLELGVNTVQILPITEFQQQGEYGWGYDSVHFNAPAPSYGNLAELREMVDGLHRHGVRVVLDVVYNHTMEDRFAGRVYSFEGLVPGYYYRRRPDGSYFNGSGVGNEFRSEAPMARRFILDSVRYWVQEVGVDGFRFDLMGLIDRETLVELTRELHALDPHLLIYGEPWAAGTTPIQVTSKGAQRGTGLAVFNDDFRDALKGHVFTPASGGFVQNGSGAEAVGVGVRGSIDSFAQNPLESINYAECHDNHTLWDRLHLSAPGTSEEQREAMDRLTAVALFTAQGIPFLQAGQEFRRSKGGADNSYNLGDAVNAVRWEDKRSHAGLFQFYRGLILMRRQHPLFRLREAEHVRQAVRVEEASPGRVSFAIEDVQGSDSWERARVLLNGSRQPQQFRLPSGTWQLHCDGNQVSPSPLRACSGSVEVPPSSGFVLAQPR
jgi:pullulanase